MAPFWLGIWTCPFPVGDMDWPLSGWGYGLAAFGLGIWTGRFPFGDLDFMQFCIQRQLRQCLGHGLWNLLMNNDWNCPWREHLVQLTDHLMPRKPQLAVAQAIHGHLKIFEKGNLLRPGDGFGWSFDDSMGT